MKISKLNFDELKNIELENVKGGGEPIPGAEIYLEFDPDDLPIISSGITCNPSTKLT